jgi:adenylate kinase
MIATAPARPSVAPVLEPRSAESSEPQRRYRTLLLFGAPGSGKGTVGKALGSIPGFVHCACGDVFRTMDLSSAIGRVFVDYSSKGLLVPDDTTIALWKNSIDGLVTTHRFVPERDLLILDGIPRNGAQARIMDEYIDVQHVFHLVCRDEQLMFDRLRRRALKENRLDDASEEVIRRRWRVYEEESRSVLAHYPADLVEEVDAMASPVAVIHNILGSILRQSGE